MKKLLILFLAISCFVVQAQTISVTFKKVIPDGYDPSNQLSNFFEVSPNAVMPAGHVYVKPPAKQGQTWPGVFSKGVTHWDRHSADILSYRSTYPDREYNGVPTIPEIFGFTCSGGPDVWVNGYNTRCWPNGPYTDTQARAKANEIWNAGNAANLWIGETMENFPYMPQNNAMWGSFYDELATKYEAKKSIDGKPFYLCHNYFADGGATLFGTREQAEVYYNTPVSSWPQTLYHPGGTLSRTNTVMEGIYLNAIDLLPQQTMTALFKMEQWTKMGKYTGIFMQNMLEWGPIFHDRVDFPEGSLYRSGKPVHDPNYQIMMSFLAHEYGQIFVAYGEGGSAPPNKKPVEFYQPVHQNTDTWRPNAGQPASFPFYFQTGVGLNADYYAFLNVVGDYSHFGNLLWMQTGGQVAAGTPYYCSYKLDNGSWFERKANGSDLIHAYYDQRGVARCRIQGNKMVLFYFNLFADNLKHTIQIKHPTDPSKIYTSTVAGSGIHVTMIDL